MCQVEQNKIFEDGYSLIEPQIAEGVHQYPFDPGCPVDVRSLKFEQEQTVRMNRHNYFEVVYLHSGEVTYQVCNRYFNLKRGDLFVMGSALMHRMSDYPKGTAKASVMYFLPESICSEEPPAEALEFLRPFLIQDVEFPHVIPASTGVPSQVIKLLGQISSHLPASTDQHRLFIRTYLRLILVLLLEHYAGYEGDQSFRAQRLRDMARLQPLFKYVDCNYASPISVGDAASVLTLRKPSFMRLFKQVTGETFIGYLNRFRVAKAEQLLASTDLSISSVGREVGYEDQSYFGLTFRHLLKKTPREYRQEMQSSRQSAS